MNIFEVIKNRPLEVDPKSCPFCGEVDIETNEHEQTTVGGIRGEDRNHHWYRYNCNKCKGGFTTECKKGNFWQTVPSKPPRVLCGVSSCWEPYEYQCIKCEGPVHRSHRDTEGNPTKCLCETWTEDGRRVKNYVVHYECQRCGHGGRVDSEYPECNQPHVQATRP